MRGGASHVAAIQKITQHFPLEPAMRVSMDGDESLRRDGYFYRMRQTTCNVVVDPNDGGKSKGLCPSDAVRQDPVGTGSWNRQLAMQHRPLTHVCRFLTAAGLFGTGCRSYH